MDINIDNFDIEEVKMHFNPINVDSILMSGEQNKNHYFQIFVENYSSIPLYFPGIKAYGIDLIYPFQIDSYEKRGTGNFELVNTSLLDLFKPYEKIPIDRKSSKYFLTCFNIPEVGEKQTLKFYYQTELEGDNFFIDSISIKSEEGKLISQF